MTGFKNGFAFRSSSFKGSGLPIIRITNISGQRIDETSLKYFNPADYKEDLSSFTVSQGDVVIAMSGATTAKVAVNHSSRVFYLNQRVGKFVPHDSLLDRRYLYHWLSIHEEAIYALSLGGAQPNLSSEKLKQMPFLLPSLERQAEIVELLDKFDALVNDLSSGLPAELAARRKQYEHYRDSLLTFAEYKDEAVTHPRNSSS